MFLSMGRHRGTVVSTASSQQKGSQPKDMQVKLIGGSKDSQRYEHEHEGVSYVIDLFKVYPTSQPKSNRTGSSHTLYHPYSLLYNIRSKANGWMDIFLSRLCLFLETADSE